MSSSCCKSVEKRDAVLGVLQRFFLHLNLDGPSYFAEGVGWTLLVWLSDESWLLSSRDDLPVFLAKSGFAALGATSLSALFGAPSVLAKQRCAPKGELKRRGPTRFSYSLIGTFASNFVWQALYDATKKLLDSFIVRSILVGLGGGAAFFVLVFTARLIRHICACSKLGKNLKKEIPHDVAGAFCSMLCAGFFMLTNEGSLRNDTTYTSQSEWPRLALDLFLSGLSTLMGYISADFLLELSAYVKAKIQAFYRYGAISTSEEESLVPTGST